MHPVKVQSKLLFPTQQAQILLTANSKETMRAFPPLLDHLEIIFHPSFVLFNKATWTTIGNVLRLTSETLLVHNQALAQMG